MSVPQATPVQPVPVRLQVTPPLAGSLVVAAVRARVAPAFTVVLGGGVIVTTTMGTVSVIDVLIDGSATDVAVMTTDSAAGGVAGEV